MKATLIELLTSKKFLAALAAIIVYVAGHFGLDIQPAALDPIWQVLVVYVGAQGLADIGKGAKQALPAPTRTTTTVATAPLAAADDAITTTVVVEPHQATARTIV
jgi:hypothetical protein